MAETITTISPITNEGILTRTGVSEADFPRILEASTRAFTTFRKTHPLPARQAIVKRALELLRTRADTLGRELTEHMGRPIQYTPGEIATAVKRGEYLLGVSNDVLAATPGEPEAGFRRYITKEPLGPILVVFAWNYPYLILINSLVPALLAGNTVLLKPSPQTPTVAEHVRDVFAEAGLPADVIQVVHCGNNETLQRLVRRAEVRAVAFTGSVAGGIAVQTAAAGRVVPVGLELGGNDPAYVRADVDVRWAAENIVDGAVFNSGQSCCAIERVYVHESVYEAFVAELVRVLEGYRLGDPREKDVQVGPVVSRAAAERIREHVKDAVEKGARKLTPDVFAAGEALGPNFVRPELLVDCTHEMRVMREETFGPVIPVMKVKDDQEAVRLMNDSDLGLTASVWTKDVKMAEEELIGEIEAGTVYVNRCDYPAPDLAWTGWKDSGRGQTLSKFGFDGFVRLKSWHVKEYPQ